MKLLTKLYLIAILVLCTTSTWAQGKFSPGYAVKSNGDTLRGLIRNEGWERSPTFFEFKKSSQDIEIEKLHVAEIRSFQLEGGIAFQRARIGVLKVDLSQTYSGAPSLVAKDSATLFLRNVYQSNRLALFEFVNESSEPHYFLSKNGGALVELYNYPFYRLMGEKKYLLIYDEYKKQLPALLSDAPDFQASTPVYNLRGLRKYLTGYDDSFGDKKASVVSHDHDYFEFDLHILGGSEGWKESDMSLKTRAFYGFGVRLNLPRKFHNRYFRINYTMIPGVSTKETYGYAYDEKLTLKTIDLGIGTYIGAKNLRPSIGIDYSFPLNTWRSVVLGPHFGLYYKRMLGVEMGHFANLGTVISEAPFFNAPRISVNYFLNINQFKKNK